ncbi:MAG TPA: caspase family protein [Kofleriaceae bacterium]|nr:caspase family protein [Kofleriaceae bacterium]
MTRRALVLGSQIEGLRGVHNDVQRMAAMLDARGFVVDLRVGADATRAGMVAGYDQLIAASGPDDAAVVYYCGHGYYAVVPDEERSWQSIVPTDLRDGSTTDWRGITAWELSIKQAQLTARTRNVTVILDCCHSAQLSRSDGVVGALPRALPHPVHTGFEHHLAALRATYGAAFDAVDPVGDPHAVRIVACGQSESAFEYPDAEGQYHGVFTDVLVDVLTRVGAAPVSWGAIVSAIRAQVLRRFPRQRPDIEGPVRREPFSLAEHDDVVGVAVAVAGEQFRLAVGQLTGAAVGDVYAVLPDGAPAHDDAGALARLEVTEVFATTALARRTTGDQPIPAKAIAVPSRRCAVRRPVAIEGDRPARAAVEAAITASPTLRPAQPGELGALATVRVESDAVTIADAGGALFPPASIAAGLEAVVVHLANLGVAQGLRELEGEHGVLASELAVELGTVHEGQLWRLPGHGGVLGLDDRYYVKLERCGQRPLFVHLLNISARGKLTLLTHFAPGGIVLDRHRPALLIGQRADGAVLGVGLRWPEGMPRDGARLTEFMVIATLCVTDLSGLETRELAVTRSGGNQLQRVVAQLCNGAYRGPGGAGPLDGFLIKRCSVLLDPGVQSTGDLAPGQYTDRRSST